MWGKVLNYVGTYVSDLQIVVICGPSVWIVLFKMLISVMAFWFLYRLLLWWCLYHVLIIVIISMGNLTLNWAVIHIRCDGTSQLCVFVLLYRCPEVTSHCAWNKMLVWGRGNAWVTHLLPWCTFLVNSSICGRTNIYFALVCNEN